MKTLSYIFFIFLLFFTNLSLSQNLVQNGDFEQYSGCPTSFQQIDSLLFWFNPSTHVSGTPDYFNQCSNPSGVGVPDNYYGYQQAHSGGGYSGIGLYSTHPIFPDWREYIEVPLVSPLTSNQCYYFEMYISLANSSPVTTDEIGVYFSNTAIIGVNNSLPLPYTPQVINSTGFISDTLNWTLISGNYLSSGGESYLIIGNFENDFNTDTLSLKNSNGQWIYVYIDDVSLSPCTGLDEQDSNLNINIYPNPSNNKIQISTSFPEIGLAEIFDLTGKRVKDVFIKSNSGEISIGELDNGFYILKIGNRNFKIVKQ